MPYDDIENIYENDNHQGMYNVDEDKVYSDEVDEINTGLIEGIERSFYLGTTDVLGIPYTRVRGPRPIEPPELPTIPDTPSGGEDPEPILIDFVIGGDVAQFWSDQVGLMRGSGYESSGYLKDLQTIPLPDSWNTDEKEINCFHLINANAQRNIITYISEILNNYMTYKLSAAFAGKRPETKEYELISSGHADTTYIYNGSFGMYYAQYHENYVYDGFKHNHMLSIIRSYNILHVLFFNEHFQQRYVRKKGDFNLGEGTFQIGIDQWTRDYEDTPLPRVDKPTIKDPCCTRGTGNEIPAFSPFVRYIKYWRDDATPDPFSDGIWEYAVAPSETILSNNRKLNNIFRTILTRIKNRDTGDQPIATEDLKLKDGSTWNSVTDNISYQMTTGTPRFDGSVAYIKITDEPTLDEIDAASFKYDNEATGRNNIPPWCEIAGEQIIKIEFPSVRIDVNEEAGNGYYLWENPVFTLTVSRKSAGNTASEKNTFWDVAVERGIIINITDTGIDDWTFYNTEDNVKEDVSIPQNIASRTTLLLGNAILGAGAKYPLEKGTDATTECSSSIYMNGNTFGRYPNNANRLDDISYVYGRSTLNRRTKLHVSEKTGNANSNYHTYKIVSNRDDMNYFIHEANEEVARKIKIITVRGILRDVNAYTANGHCYSDGRVRAKHIITTFKYIHQIVQTQIVIPHPVFLIRRERGVLKGNQKIYNSKAINGICGQYTNYNTGIYDGHYSRLSISSPLYRVDDTGEIIGFETNIDPMSSDFYNSIPDGSISSNANIRSTPDDSSIIAQTSIPVGTSFKVYAKAVVDGVTWYLVEVDTGSEIVNGWISGETSITVTNEENIPFRCDSFVDHNAMGMYKLFEHLEGLSNGERRPRLITCNNDAST